MLTQNEQNANISSGINLSYINARRVARYCASMRAVQMRQTEAENGQIRQDVHAYAILLRQMDDVRVEWRYEANRSRQDRFVSL